MNTIYKKFGFSYLGGINIAPKFQKYPSLMTYVIYLLPNTLSGLINLCPFSTVECRTGCLHYSGHNKIQGHSGLSTIDNARANRTKLFFNDPETFYFLLHHELTYHHSIALASGYDFIARLNGTSDFYHQHFILTHPNIQFYDYTKNHNLLLQYLPENYHITFSFSGHNTKESLFALSKGINVSVLFNRKPKEKLPSHFCFPDDQNKISFPVIDGDIHDKRTIDDKSVIVGLRFKNISNADDQNFVLNSVLVQK